MSRHLRRLSGPRRWRTQSVHWYENRTNVPGWLSLSANLRCPGLSIYAHLWHNRYENPDVPSVDRARILDVEYSFRFLRVFRGLRLRLSWRYDDDVLE